MAMTDPALPPRTPEPAALAELARAVIVVAVGLGWATLDNATINIITSAVGLGASWALTWYVRSRVRPVVKPVTP